MLNIKGKFEYKTLFLMLFLNVIFLFIFYSTPLYNNSIYIGDSGVYQNVAKEILNGKILYKDIFDHKGPILFIFYLIPLLLKNTNLGCFFIDIIIYNFIFYFNYKIICFKRKNIIGYFLILLELFILIKSYRVISPESIMLLIISYLNYWILSKQYLNPTKTQLIICGILTAIIFWIKFTLGVYIAIIYFYFIYTHIRNKTFNYKYILMPLIGFLIPTTIVFGYFIYNNALTDLFYTYFLVNSKYKNPGIINFDWKLLLVILFSIFLFIYSIYKKEREYFILGFAYFILIIPVFIMTKHNWVNLYTLFIGLISILSIINMDIINKKIMSVIIILLLLIFSYNVIIYNFSLKYSSNYNNKINEFSESVNNNVGSVARLYMADALILENIKNINYKYFYTPCFTYEQFPEMWNTIYDDVKNKNIEYVIVSTDDITIENSFDYNHPFANSEKTIKFIEKINSEIIKNYDIYGQYNNYVVYKRKN